MPATNPVPVFPEAGPAVNGRNVTLSEYVKSPTTIARDFRQLYSAYSFTGRLLPDSGSVTGGAVKFYPNDPENISASNTLELLFPFQQVQSTSFSHFIEDPLSIFKAGDRQLSILA